MKILRRKLYFTLIELLVVISIIAILASVLLPSLISAKRAVMRINCAKNLKQIGMCSEMYINDFQGWLPPMSIANRTGIGWRILIREYAGYKAATSSESRTGSIFVCPIVPDRIYYEISYQGSYGHYFTGYGYNSYLTLISALKISSISTPSKFIVYGDTYDETETITYVSKFLYGHEPTTRIGDRHQSGINTGWADGHVEWHKALELQNHTDWYNP